MKARRAIREDLVDAVVLEVYGLVRDEGWLADRALERVLRREKRLWAAERRAASEALYGLVRMQGQLDFLLWGAPGGPALRYAGFLARFGNLSRDAAAKRFGLDPKALAALDGADARIAALPDPVERLAMRESLPRWIVQVYVDELGLDEAQALAKAMNARAPLTVRANLLKTTRDELGKRLAREGVESVPTPLSPWGLVLDGRANAFALQAFKDGLFEIQDEGSQLIALSCGARPGKRAVDACAGAGGKTLALAMEMRNKGSIEALDSDADRLEEAKRRARRAGVHNVRTRAIAAGPEAAAQVEDLAGKADVVLVDAPCAGLGTLRRKPDARWRLDATAPDRFSALQKELVARFAKLVAPRGRLVFATCSIGAKEGGDVADFVERELGFAPVPLARTLGEELAARLGGGDRLRLYPHRHGTDGFFAAAFERG